MYPEGGAVIVRCAKGMGIDSERCDNEGVDQCKDCQLLFCLGHISKEKHECKVRSDA